MSTFQYGTFFYIHMYKFSYKASGEIYRLNMVTVLSSCIFILLIITTNSHGSQVLDKKIIFCCWVYFHQISLVKATKILWKKLKSLVWTVSRVCTMYIIMLINFTYINLANVQWGVIIINMKIKCSLLTNWLSKNSLINFQEFSHIF